MTPQPLQYRPSQNDLASPSVVHVERAATGGVVVRVSYPPGKFQEATIGTVLACIPFVMFPVVAFWMFGRSFSGRHSLFLLFAAFPAVVVIPLLLWRASRLAQSYTLEADGDGITVHRYRGRREWSERLPRESIIDVRLGFGGGGKSGRSTAWLIIALRAPYRFNRRLLHDLGGNHLARVADAVREGLGLEPVDWPSGRPRKARTATPVEPQRRRWADPERLQALLIGLAFTLVGSFFAVSGGRDAWQVYDRLHHMRPTTCVLLDKRLTNGAGEHTWSSRHGSPHYYAAWARVSYDDDAGASHIVTGDLFPTNQTETGGTPYVVLQGMNVGGRYPLWVDDRGHGHFYLSRGDESPWASGGVMAVVGSFMALGGVAFAVGGLFFGEGPRPAVRAPANPVAPRQGVKPAGPGPSARPATLSVRSAPARQGEEGKAPLNAVASPRPAGPHPLQYRPAENPGGGSPSWSTVHVERLESGGVRVQVTRRTGQRREARIGFAIAGGLAAVVFGAIVFVFSSPSYSAGVLLLPGALELVVLNALFARRGLLAAQSYTLEADGDGITIHYSRGRREWCERLPRERITDVRIGGGGRPRHFASCLIIALKPWYRGNRTLLHDLGGHLLAQVADALRAGIGLSPRS